MTDSITLKNKSGGCGGMIGGVLFGLIAFLASFVVLFWNEGRAVQTYNSLNEGAAAVVSVGADSVVAANNGKLVYVSGMALTNDVATDTDFGISVKAIKLQRNVQMYQWKETSKSGNNNTTTYTYDKTWSSSLISSRNFKQSGHENPTEMRFKSADFVANNVTLGAFTLSKSLVNKMSGGRSLAVDTVPYTLPASVKDQTKVSDGYFYIGQGVFASPQVGDVQVKFTVIEPTTVSVISGQKDKTFAPYKTTAGDELDMLEMGAQTPDEMFKSAQDTNTLMTWILRGGGFIAMYIGAALLLSPATMLLKFIPFFGELVERALLLVAFAITFLLSFVTMSIAWMIYHPLIGLSLLCVGVAVFGGVIALAILAVKVMKK